MRLAAARLSDPGGRTHLPIRFTGGERPHLFWLSRGSSVPRYRVLSKRCPDGTVDVLVTLQDEAGKRALGGLRVEPDAPTGWLERWVAALGEELACGFERFDLREADTPDLWRRRARALGWLPPGAEP